MKKIIAIVLILMFVCCSTGNTTSLKDTLTPSQSAELQLGIDIFGECIATEIIPYVAKNYTTEYAVTEAFRLCSNEGHSVVRTLEGFGADKKLQLKVLVALFNQCVRAIDDERNALSEKREKKPMRAPQRSL